MPLIVSLHRAVYIWRSFVPIFIAIGCGVQNPSLPLLGVALGCVLAAGSPLYDVMLHFCSLFSE